MKVQIEFDLTIRSSRVALMTMITAIDKLDIKPERRRDSGDVSTSSAGDGEATGTLVVQTGEVVASGESSTPLTNGSGDPAKEAEPEHLRGRGDGSGDEPAPPPRRRGRRAAPAPEEPPEPPPATPVAIEGKALKEDVSGPDDETVTEHSILSPDFRLETIGKDGFGRSKLTGEKYEISVTEARETALQNLQEVFRTGDPKVRSEIAAYQRELGLKAFRDCPDDQAYAMYRRSIELMHAVGKSA